MSPRHRPRLDANQREVVETLRAFGCSVQSLASVGKGCPDLLVGYRGLNILLEVKDGTKKPSARVLTEDEARWHTAWGGRVHVVYSAQDAVETVGLAVAHMLGVACVRTAPSGQKG